MWKISFIIKINNHNLMKVLGLFFITDFNLLGCELDNLTFTPLHLINFMLNQSKLIILLQLLQKNPK